MKSLKKMLLLILALALVMTSLVMLFSCGEDPCTEHKDENSDGKCDVCGKEIETGTPDSIELIKDGKANFKIVIREGSTGAVRIKVNQGIVSVLDGFGIEVETVDDKTDTATEYEVIVNGASSRGDEYNVDPHYLGTKGYAVKLIGTKVMIMAGSDKALDDAIKYFMEDVLGITSKTESVGNVTMTSEMSFEEIQTGYAVTSVSIAGNDLKDYVIAIGSGAGNLADLEISTAAKSMQTLIYEKTGAWLNIVQESTNPAKAIFIRVVKEACEDGFSVTEKDGNLVIETEFYNKLNDTVLTFVRVKITNAKGDVKLPKGFSYTKDVRNIYYKDFGAKGDGTTDDFKAIADCHEYANKYGHTVNADSDNPVYCIGHSVHGTTGYKSVVIQTDTNWEGAKFIFDDRLVAPNTAAYNNPIFHLAPTNSSTGYSGDNVPIKGSLIQEETTNIGWAPGFQALIIIYDKSERHFIRWGSNENNGSEQHEILLVDKDGNIDPSTPLQWTYNSVTSMTVYRVDDEPITVTGGAKGCDIQTKYNQAPSEYTYYQRNIRITRSNSTLSGIRHTNTDYGETGAPMGGFTQVQNCNNVVIENMLFECPKGFDTTGASGDEVGMGSYEITANTSNNVTWRHCRQSNFFRDGGKVIYDGMMGTNYCKNLYFDDMFVCSFDAHCGTYNATVENSTIEHLNFIGEGLIKIRNTTIYADGGYAGMLFRQDYGSTWQGTVDVDGLELRTSKSNAISLIGAQYTNHYFGYTCYLPETINIKNVRIVRFSYTMVNGQRVETQEAVNDRPLYLYQKLDQYVGYDISSPEATTSNEKWQNDWEACSCAENYAAAALTNDIANINEIPESQRKFNDTDGDGRCNNKRIVQRELADGTMVWKRESVWCWGFAEEPDNSINVNPTVVTKTVNASNCGDLVISLPPTPAFENTVVNQTREAFTPWYAPEQNELNIVYNASVPHANKPQ